MIGKVRRQAFAAASQAYAAASEGRSLIADLQDGFGVELEVEVADDAAKTLAKILVGKGGTIPLKLKAKIDPTVDV
jgi:hypothetical protein